MLLLFADSLAMIYRDNISSCGIMHKLSTKNVDKWVEKCAKVTRVIRFAFCCASVSIHRVVEMRMLPGASSLVEWKR
jgi:uncharacterized protein (UPF0248 family)